MSATPPTVPNPALIYDFYVGLPSPTNLPVFSGLSYLVNNQITNQTYYVVARDNNLFASAPTMLTTTVIPAPTGASFTQSVQEVFLNGLGGTTGVATSGSVTFTDTSPNANISSWKISDGRTLVGRSITLNFAFSSTFTVILTSTGTLGCPFRVVFGTVVVREALATNLDNSDNSEVKIYPNPAQNYIKIENLNKNTSPNTRKYSVFDMFGREILKGDFSNNQQEINIQNISKGIYYLQIIDNKEIIKKFFVKN